jgi:uncharacterized membrane protein YkoI
MSPTTATVFSPGSGAAPARRRAPQVALAALTAGLALLAAAPARAHGDEDHDRARAALRAGEVLPLATLLERLRRSHPGEVLGVELERDDGRWRYEIKLLQPDGQLRRLELDARSGELLRERRRKGDDGAYSGSAPVGGGHRR